MSTLGFIIIFSLISSVLSLAGGLVLLFKEKLALRFSHLFASFAAGALLGAAFFDLIPEATKISETDNLFLWVLVGFLLFFVLERFIRWFHHHHEHPQAKPTVSLVMIGDTIHNFIDGVAVAATFLVNPQLGVVTALAVAAHEVPQEIGDFGVMIHNGLSKTKVITFNIFSASAAVVGALLTYITGPSIERFLPAFLAITAGFFIYIAASDLIPEIHQENRKGFAFYETMLIVGGILAVYFSTAFFE